MLPDKMPSVSPLFLFDERAQFAFRIRERGEIYRAPVGGFHRSLFRHAQADDFPIRLRRVLQTSQTRCVENDVAVFFDEVRLLLPRGDS